MLMTMATATTTTPTTMMAAMATTTDGEVEHDEGDDDDNDNNNDVNIDVIEDDGDNGSMMMRWQRGRMDDNDGMAMGGQRPAERSRAPRHPSEATINLCQQFGEELTRERDNFGGGDDRKGSMWN